MPFHSPRCDGTAIAQSIDSRFFQCLEHTVRLPSEQRRILDEAHRKRNVAEYEGYLDVDQGLVEALIRVAQEVATRSRWLRSRAKRVSENDGCRASRDTRLQSSYDIKAIYGSAKQSEMPTPHYPPAAVRRILHKLGNDVRDARRRRRLPMAVVAERAFTSRSTLQRVEAGDSNVSVGIYASVLQALGLLEGLGEIADITRDRSVRRWQAPSYHNVCGFAGRRQKHPMPDFEVHIDLEAADGGRARTIR